MKKFLYILFFIFVFGTAYAQEQPDTNNIFTDFGTISVAQNIDTSNFATNQAELLRETIKFDSRWWITILLTIGLILFTVVYYIYHDEFTTTSKALFQGVYFRQIYEQNVFYTNFLITLNILFYIETSILFFLYLTNYSLLALLNNYTFYLITIGAILGFFSIKYVFAKFWEKIFEEKQFSQVYLSSILIANSVIAPVLLFLLFFILFNPFLSMTVFYISFSLFVIVFILRVLRLFSEFFYQGFSLFYLILYLCTVEILPILVAIKYFSIV